MLRSKWLRQRSVLASARSSGGTDFHTITATAVETFLAPCVQENLCVVLDVGPTMRESGGIQAGVEAIRQLLLQKVLLTNV